MPQVSPSLGLSFLQWFRNESQQHGVFTALHKTLGLLTQFVRESLPDRRRQRYGDIDFDWDYRVDTSSATVGWREHLLGLFHSPYQPTDPALFHEMMDKLNIDFCQFVFVDIGSGKGRVLLMAADYPFRRIIGIELLPPLHRIAVENMGKFRSDSQRCFAIEAICQDAAGFIFPPEPLVIYLFNPLPEAELSVLLANLERSLKQKPRPVFVLYHNPLLEHVLSRRKWLRRIQSTQQYAMYTNSAPEGFTII